MAAKILLGLAILFTVCSLGLGLKTKSKVSAIRSELDTANTTVTQTTAEKTKIAAEAKAAKEELAVVNTAKEAADAAVKAEKADNEKVKAEAADAAAKLAAKEDELKKLNDAIANATPVPAATPDPKVLADLEEAKKKADEQAVIAKAAQTKLAETESRAKSLEEEKARRDASLSKPGLEGKVLAVNPNWNFVVLSVGDRQGVAMNSTFVVKRGSSMIAKLRITSVEPSTAIADIVRGSGPKGTAVEPGDVVIFGGS
ncbi:MAG: hypothetical protein WCP06_00955 [Verrucomicrobiota bacterium]